VLNSFNKNILNPILLRLIRLTLVLK
jgi:hypothetical protein